MAITPSDFSFAQELTGADYTLSGATEIFIDENSVDSTFFAAVKNGGGDIRLCTDDTGATEIPIDVVECDTTGSTLKLFARRPTYTTASRNLFLFAGNAAANAYANTDTFGRDNVYQDCLYASHEGLTDVTGNSTPTESGTTLTTGPFGNSNAARVYNVDNTDSLYAAGLTISRPFTMMGFGNAGTDLLTRVISVGDAGSPNDQINLGTNFNAGVAATIGVAPGGAASDAAGDAGDRTTGTWRHYTARINSTTDRKVYLNGGTATATNTTADSATTLNRVSLGVSADSTPFGRQPITIAEPRVYSSGLADTHIEMLYDMWSDPATFWTQGTPYDPSAGGAVEVSDTVSNVDITSLNETVTLLGQIQVTDSLVNVNISSLDESVSIIGNINVSDSAANVNITSLNETVTLAAVISVNDTLSNTNITPINETVTIGGAVDVSDTVSSINATSINESVLAVGQINVSDTLVNINITSLDETIVLSTPVVVNDGVVTINVSPLNDTVLIAGAVNVQDSVANIDINVYRPTITIGEAVITPSTYTITFKEDGYSIEFKPDDYTIEFGD